jgi:hypothetical protein
VARSPTRCAHAHHLSTTYLHQIPHTHRRCLPLSRNYPPNSPIKEPRIRIGIPICGCPDYLALIEQRAERLGIPRTPPYFPASLRALVRANDTVPATAAAFAGKRILVLAGADDKLVPWETSRTFVEALDVGRGGRKVVMVVPGVKHEFTDGMREEVFQFFWEEALIRGAAVLNCAL